MIAVTGPVATDRLYAERLVTISWTDTTTQNVSIYLSTDGGASYDPTPLLAAVPSSSGANSAVWGPTVTGAAIRLKVESDVNPGTDYGETEVLELRAVTLNVIGPSGTMNPLGLALSGWCNIVWDTGTDADVGLVSIHLSTDGGTTFPLTIATGVPNLGQFMWDVSLTLSTSQAGCRIRIRSDLAGDQNNWVMSADDFAVQSADLLAYPSGNDYAPRFDTFSRVGGLKAIENHEAVMRGQLEAGSGITITYRGETGGANRRNIVIATERQAARMLSGEVLCQTSPGDGYTAASGRYGDHLTGDIIHGWSLTSPWAVEAHFESIPEAAETLEGVIVPQWEAAGPDTVRVHIILKGTPVTAPAKDDVAVIDSRRFRFTLIEITG